MAKKQEHRVMLRQSAAGAFRRSVRQRRTKSPGDQGEIIKTLIFEPGMPVTLNEKEFAAVADDLGHALVEVEMERRPDGGERPRQVTPEPAPMPPAAKNVAPAAEDDEPDDLGEDLEEDLDGDLDGDEDD